MRKWNVPLTYQPKIQPVKEGRCKQTIRFGRKYSPGDLIRFYTWTGRPYHSKREDLTGYMKITEVLNILVSKNGWGEVFPDSMSWSHPISDIIARLDGIVPPTGEALRDVLIDKNGAISPQGIEAQIVRWE